MLTVDKLALEKLLSELKVTNALIEVDGGMWSWDRDEGKLKENRVAERVAEEMARPSWFPKIDPMSHTSEE